MAAHGGNTFIDASWETILSCLQASLLILSLSTVNLEQFLSIQIILEFCFLSWL